MSVAVVENFDDYLKLIHMRSVADVSETAEDSVEEECSYEHVALNKRGQLDLMTKHGVVLRVAVDKSAIVDVPDKGRCVMFEESCVEVEWNKSDHYEAGSMLLSKSDFMKRYKDAMVIEALDRLVTEGIMQYGDRYKKPTFELDM